MQILNEFIKHRLITKYIYEVAPVLLKSYGLHEQYTVPQIEKAAMKCGVSMQYIPYAIALYRHEVSNRTLRLYRLDQGFLDILRDEIAVNYFDGSTYRAKDVFKLARPREWRGGHNRSRANMYGRTSTY